MHRIHVVSFLPPNPGEGCDFFMWAEDNPALVLSELTLQETRDEWRQRKTALLSKSLTKLPIPELKKVNREVTGFVYQFRSVQESRVGGW